MRLKIRFFSTLREVVGRTEFDVDVSAARTVGELWSQLTLQFPKLSQFNASRAMAVNHEYAQAEQELHAGDEVAFFPPVSGG
jgi:molybdopterin converting factor subunit 1